MEKTNDSGGEEEIEEEEDIEEEEEDIEEISDEQGEEEEEEENESEAERFSDSIPPENEPKKKMEILNKPTPLAFTANIAENWNKFKDQLEIFLTASEQDTKSDRVKAAILKNLIGEDALDLLKTMDMGDEERASYNAIVKKLEEYCVPKKNILYERFVFYKRKQSQGESFDEFLADIKKLAKPCEFGQAKDEMLRDRIVLGIFDTKLQEKLLCMTDHSLEKVTEKCRVYERSTKQTKEVQGEATTAVEMVRKFRRQEIRQNSTRSQMKRACTYCGLDHRKGACTAYGKICAKCGRKNHFANVCRARKINEMGEQVSDYDTECSDEEATQNIHSITCNIDSLHSWYENININNYFVRFKLDTGADTNVIAVNLLREITTGNLKMEKTNVTLTAFGGFKIKPLGKVSLDCKHKAQRLKLDFIVVNEGMSCILGIQACVALGLITRIQECKTEDERTKFMEKNADLFEGIGKFKYKATLEVMPNSIPRAMPPKRIPLNLTDKLKKKLEDLENKGVIEKFDGPAEWIHKLVVREKPNGDLRLCLDPHFLNMALKKQYYQLPTLKDLADVVKNCTHFSVLDIREGFHHVELDEKAQKLCIFSTPFGCYKYKRLPFGLSVATDIFQEMNVRTFGHINGLFIFVDDILIAGKSKEDHDKKLQEVCNTARANNIKFNKNKVQLCVQEVKYMGRVFNKNGMKANDDNIKAILKMRSPTNTKELLSFLGMINYLRQFLPHLAEMTSNLRQLLKKDNEWQWLHAHENEFKALKKAVTQTPVLQIFDNSKEIVLQTDASKDGCGCCMLQDGKPVTYNSRCFTDTEKEYAQIEKEFIAILYACKKNHELIYGRKVIVHTDHLPLVSIMKKEVSKITSARLKRIRMKLLCYRLEVKHVPGKNMHIADLLSRMYIEEDSENEIVNLNGYIHTISMSNERKKQLQTETGKDEILQKLIKIYQSGWPKDRKDCEECIKQYWKLKDEIYVENNLVFYDGRVIIPYRLRKEYVQRVHEGHFGMNRTYLRAKEIMFWIGMKNDIEQAVEKCRICERHQISNKKEPLIMHEIPDYPFQKVGVDIAELNGKNYLIMKDYLSKWLDIRELKTKTIEEIIAKFRRVFSNCGIPEIIYSDNSPFNSHKYKAFSEEYGFKISTSSPTYAQSNGMSESAVATAKRILKKAHDAKTNYLYSLLEYRNTPIPEIGTSPAEMMFGRKLRSKLPVEEKSLKQRNTETVRETIARNHIRMQKHYNRNATSRPEFHPNQNVLIQKKKQWQPAKIIEKCNEPRSYIVEDDEGSRFRRNKIHIRKSANRFDASSDSEEENNNNNNHAHSQTHSQAQSSNARNNTNNTSQANQHQQSTEPTNAPTTTSTTTPTTTPTAIRNDIRSAPSTNQRQTKSGRQIISPNYYRSGF